MTCDGYLLQVWRWTVFSILTWLTPASRCCEDHYGWISPIWDTPGHCTSTTAWRSVSLIILTHYFIEGGLYQNVRLYQVLLHKSCLQLPVEEYHEITTVSSTPSYFKYMYINATRNASSRDAEAWQRDVDESEQSAYKRARLMLISAVFKLICCAQRVYGVLCVEFVVLYWFFFRHRGRRGWHHERDIEWCPTYTGQYTCWQILAVVPAFSVSSQL